MFELLVEGFAAVMNPGAMFLMLFGSIWGIVFAAVPGLSTGMAVVLALPLTYGMNPINGLATLSGIYVGGMSGGLISSTLLGIPGTSSAVATTFDGFPMARNGFPGKAMGIGIWASFVGGLFGALVLLASAPAVARVASKMGPWEYTSLVILGLTMIASLTGKSISKGFISGVLGVLVGTVGSDPIFGANRLTFGVRALRGGLHFVPVMIGLFALSQLMNDIENNTEAREYNAEHLRIPNRESLTAIGRSMRALWISMISGVAIGALPGVGATISSIWSYDQVKRFSKNKELFGNGSPEGIIAAEASNSSTAGGTLIPTLALGLPGSPIASVMMGALMIHGIAPGPLFITNHARIAYGLFASFFIVNILVLLVQLVFTRIFVKVLSVPVRILAPMVMVFCVIGSYAHNNRMADVFVMLGSGIVGYALTKIGIPLAPLILGLILGPTLEENIRVALMGSPDLTLFVTRPASLFFLLVSVGSVALVLWERSRSTAKSFSED